MSNVSCEFCEVVRFMFEKGAISRGTAILAESFISQNRENARDYGDLFELLNPKTGKRDFLFHSVDVSLFLEFAFSHELQNVHHVAALFMKWASVVSRGIAAKIVQLRGLNGRSAYQGSQYYWESCKGIFSELAYGGTDWQLVRLQSIQHETRAIPYSQKRENGMFMESMRDRTVYILNNEIVCRNTKRAEMIEREFLRCENSLVMVTPTGDIIIPSKRERFVDSDGNVKTRIVEIEPTFSHLRLFITVVRNSFFALELGPQTHKADKLAAEHRDARRSRKPEREERIDVVLGSENFSEQEKNIARAMDLVFNYKFENGVLSFANFRQTGVPAVFDMLYGNFCAIANTRPHKEHFRKMVKNFKRHLTRYFNQFED